MIGEAHLTSYGPLLEDLGKVVFTYSVIPQGGGMGWQGGVAKAFVCL